MGEKTAWETIPTIFQAHMLFTENEHILVDFLFLPGQLPARPAICWEPLAAMIVVGYVWYPLLLWNQRDAKSHWWSWGRSAGGILPESMTAEWKPENITAPSKILKSKGSNGAKTHYFKNKLIWEAFLHWNVLWQKEWCSKSALLNNPHLPAAAQWLHFNCRWRSSTV